VRESVAMTDQQAAALETALADLEQARQARRNARNRSAFDGPSPHLEFLARASQILEREQLRALVQTMAERRAEQRTEHRAERGMHDGRGPGGVGPGHGPGAGPGMHGPRQGGHHGRPDGVPGPLAELDLSVEQRQAVREAARVLHQTMQTLRTQFRDGTLSETAFHEAVTAAHAQFETAVAAVLTAEQNARWQELRRERATTALERAIAHMRANQERHLELLAQILGLDETQRAGFATIGADLLANMEALLQGVRDGSIDVAQVRTERQRLHTEARTAMRALLTAEQATLFDALDGFLYRPRGPMP
jgi:Spy/CpxP family protein refolding chaperone